MRVCCFSTFPRADAARAQVMAETLRRMHPDWELWGVLVDGPGPVAGFDHVLGVEELGIPRLRNWLFRHDVRAACAAVKGVSLLHLLERGADGVVYFDPAVGVFNRLDPVVEGFSQASVLLSPQQIVPAASAAEMARERPALLRGVFNLGFLGVRNDAEGRRFASWWAGMLEAGCVDDPQAGLFLDQKYCDLVPGMFFPTAVLRDAGCHVGAWNVASRGLRFDGRGTLMAGDVPVRFVQFGGEAAGGIEAYELWAWHRRRVAAVGGAAEDWAFARFANGVTISAEVRALFRSRADLVAAFEDPFAVGAGSFFGWLGRERGDLLEG